MISFTTPLCTGLVNAWDLNAIRSTAKALIEISPAMMGQRYN